MVEKKKEPLTSQAKPAQSKPATKPAASTPPLKGTTGTPAKGQGKK